MQDFESKSEQPEARLTELARSQAKVTEVYHQRCTKALQRYRDAVMAAAEPLKDGAIRSASPVDLWRDANTYWVDFTQRSVLFWDTLRQRGNNWLEHEKAGKPPLLAFDWEMVADARTFERPVNYALIRIIPPDGIKTDPARRPFVIIDPRAGHGPGIGGFKQDSQVGVALKAAHPVYFVIFFPDPVSGQTLADVSRAEAEFLRIVGKLHPKTSKPVLFGNCQGGWASMMIGAVEPDLVGPIVINGAPMSYWAGNDGENPMRYAGGLLGGLWPALLASDLGGGKFDGAYLVENFENLNPGNAYFDKFYRLFSEVDTEPERFLEFERWWGGFFLMNRQEIKWIVENLFVGNNLADGDAEWSEGRAFDLRSIKSPIILFASLGDNITPPQQAFNWVADLYPTTEALKANGQVIVGMMHKSVGHLGIFVSGQVAKREYTQIVDLIDYIEHLPPGLYGMQVEEQITDGNVRYDVLLTERQVEDLHVLQKYSRKDEMPFEAVEKTSETLASAYETFVHPFVAPLVTPAAAELTRAFHSQRTQRWAVSDLNPFLWPLKGMANMAKANRAPRDSEGPMVATEGYTAAVASASWDLYRDLRDAALENTFFRTYGPAGFGLTAEEKETLADEPVDLREAPLVKEALSHIEEGGRTEAMVRAALLLMKAGTGRRRLSTMKRARELFGQDMGLLEMQVAEARAVIREQSYIVDFEPVKALMALPKLLKTAEDRRRLIDLLDRAESRIETNPKQVALLSEIRRYLSEDEPAGKAQSKKITVLVAKKQGEDQPAVAAKPDSSRKARENRRTRANS